NKSVAYWMNDKLLSIFLNNKCLDEVLITREGMTTGCNDIFLRFWYEVDIDKFTQSNCCNHAKWYPYHKGGDYCKWYGNHMYIVNWENNGREIKNFRDKKTGRIRSHNYNEDYILNSGITWSAFSSKGVSFRYSSEGFLF